MTRCTYPNCMRLYGGCGMGCVPKLNKGPQAMTREPNSYRYAPEEIGELNQTIDRLRAEIEQLTTESAFWKRAYEEARDLAKTALEPVVVQFETQPHSRADPPSGILAG